MDLVEQVRQNLKEALRHINGTVNGADIGIILGSGLGRLVDAVEGPKIFPYDDIPHFPRSTTKGHAGNLVVGELAGKKVAIMQGRFHFYEGYTSAGISFPIRILKGLGVNKLIVTCAAGGLRPDLRQGDIMAITDQINLMGVNPLIGPNDDELGPRFVDMTEAYDSGLLATARAIAAQEGIDLRGGVYVGVLGPSYETPAEIRLLSTFADAVGMSTVPEVIVARHSGMRVLGFAIITNVPGSERKLSHDEVLTQAQKSSDKLLKLIIGTLENI
ncbi:MAG TPA: purine-nucleoside phosphorylase [Anaerolineae bacterium]|nr:purine-nucleoside phosphorylase [Anaerolineae bacterium]